MITDDKYIEYSDIIYRYLFSLTNNKELAEEIMQETFYQAVKSADRFDGSCKVTTWLCAIAKNSLYKYYKKHPEHSNLDAETLSDSYIEKEFLQKESYIELLKKMHDFDSDTKELMYLRIFGELSFREIGDIMSKTENWARVTFYRSKEKLKKEIKHYEK